jgi:uncharacterized membrane protein
MSSDESTSGDPNSQDRPAVRARRGHGGWRSLWGWGRGNRTGGDDQVRLVGGLLKAGSLEFERVLFFSDAVFAIAITLLVIDLRVPFSSAIQSAHVLREAVAQMIGFGIGFGLIGVFWLGHHSVFRQVVAMNGVLIRLNLLFLGTIAFLPYPTALLSAAQGQVAATVFFATWLAAAGLTEAAVWLYALRVPGLVDPALSRGQRLGVARRILVAPFVFAVSIPVAFVAPEPAEFVWIMVWVLNHLISRMTPGEETSHARDDIPAR